MRKTAAAGMTAIAILIAGSTVFGTETQAGWHHGGYGTDGIYGECHRYTVPSAGLGCRHNMIGPGSDWDISCHDVEWHYGRYHDRDEDGYCLKHGCAYEDCRYGQGSEDWGSSWQDGDYQETAVGSGSVFSTDTDSVTPATGNGNSANAGFQDYGAGNGSQENYGTGYYGNGAGCHGGGHHGNGHHGGRHH